MYLIEWFIHNNHARIKVHLQNYMHAIHVSTQNGGLFTHFVIIKIDFFKKMASYIVFLMVEVLSTQKGMKNKEKLVSWVEHTDTLSDLIQGPLCPAINYFLWEESPVFQAEIMPSWAS